MLSEELITVESVVETTTVENDDTSDELITVESTELAIGTTRRFCFPSTEVRLVVSVVDDRFIVLVSDELIEVVSPAEDSDTRVVVVSLEDIEVVSVTDDRFIVLVSDELITVESPAEDSDTMVEVVSEELISVESTELETGTTRIFCFPSTEVILVVSVVDERFIVLVSDEDINVVSPADDSDTSVVVVSLEVIEVVSVTEDRFIVFVSDELITVESTELDTGTTKIFCFPSTEVILVVSVVDERFIIFVSDDEITVESVPFFVILDERGACIDWLLI